MFSILFFCFILILLIYFVYKYKKNHYHFDSAGLKYLKGVPVFGNTFYGTFVIKHTLDDLSATYNAFPDERYVGFVDGTLRIVMIRDPTLMKSILVKDFDHFADRRQFIPFRLDPLFGSSMIASQDEAWKRQRGKLSPAFTSLKLKCMMTAMLKVSEEQVERLKDIQCDEVNLYKLFGKWSNESMTCAFGFDHSLSDGFADALSKVYLNLGRRVLLVLSTRNAMLGEFFKHMGLQLFDKTTTEFFKKSVLETMRYRQEHNIVKQDYMQVLMEASEGWTLNESAGQVFFSYLANVDTGTSIISLCIQELALHPDMQETLYQEIRNHKEVEGDLTYENMNDLKYLACVINESARKYAASLVMDRICIKPYMLPPLREGGKPYQLNPGDIVYCPVNAVHNDPRHHPDPAAFRPDRFRDDNHPIQAFTFMPFGMGPRSCVGERYMMIQMKVMIYHLLLSYKALTCDKTGDPALFIPSEFSIRPLGGSWVKLEKRY